MALFSQNLYHILTFVTLALWLPLFSFAQTTDTPKKTILKVIDQPPPGFEDLVGPQQSQVDIFYGGRVLGAALATYTPTTVEFDDPGAVARAIPNLEPGEIPAVTAALSGELPARGELICFEPGKPVGCGVLEPDIVGVIFNADYFRAEVFVNPALLQVTGISQQRYLPPPETGTTLVTQINGALSGSSSGDNSYQVRLKSVAARKASRLYLEAGLNGSDGATLENLYAEHDWQNRQAALGMLDTAPLRLAGQAEILGIRFSTQERTRVDLERLYGNQLSLFLPRRAGLDILRDSKRLVSGKIYDAGNQVLDTSDFPEGAYDLTFNIKELDGTERTETRLFVKTRDLPPLEEPLYFIEAGLLRRNRGLPGLPDYRGIGARMGLAQRLTTRFGYDIDVWLGQEEQAAGAGIFWLTRGIRLQSGLLASSTGSYGAEALGQLQVGQTTSSFVLRHLEATQTPPDNTPLPALYRKGSEASLLFSYQGMGLRANWRRDASKQTTYNVTPFLRLPIWQRGKFRLDLEAQYNYGTDDQLLLVQFNFYRNSTPWGINGEFGGRYAAQENSNNGFLGSVRADWNGRPGFGSQARVFSTFREDPAFRSLHLEGKLRHPIGGLSVFGEQVNSRDGTSQSIYGTSFSLGVVYDQAGVTLSSQDEAQSGLLIDLRGSPRGSEFDVVINEQSSVKATVGYPLLVPLEPYKLYQVHIAARNKTFAAYDTRVRQASLYPGNYQRMVWEVKRLLVLVGMLVKPDGTPLAEANILNAVGPAETDSAGLFQAEVHTNVTLEVETKSGAICRAEVPLPKDDENFMVVDTLTCS